MANIRDIAKRSGYSASTVSRFINHSGYVSDTAQEEIQQVIDEFDYVPNAIARDLSTGKRGPSVLWFRIQDTPSSLSCFMESWIPLLPKDITCSF
ncbi:LacI family DNA-binding transcriptional regulator [Pediococcus stilesii]|uniref:LacI family DNA-binding transcriptional regulator n=1 Tax=Pediococcus stilesii TaxID=331679 RepID=UPI001F011EA8|nr:LacI family DNA-binding transcriptional regulator [Pediococcus stilesii]